MRNEVSEWFMKRRLQSCAEEWGQQLWTIRKMIFILFFLATVLEIVMFFVLQATGMLEHTPARYLLRYVIRPFIINSVIITIGTLVSRVATKSLWRERVHMIFIDHMMPKMDGVEMLHQLQQETYAINKDTTTFLPLILCFLPLAQKGFTARKKGIHFRL